MRRLKDWITAFNCNAYLVVAIAFTSSIYHKIRAEWTEDEIDNKYLAISLYLTSCLQGFALVAIYKIKDENNLKEDHEIPNMLVVILTIASVFAGEWRPIKEKTWPLVFSTFALTGVFAYIARYTITDLFKKSRKPLHYKIKEFGEGVYNMASAIISLMQGLEAAKWIENREGEHNITLLYIYPMATTVIGIAIILLGWIIKQSPGYQRYKKKELLPDMTNYYNIC